MAQLAHYACYIVLSMLVINSFMLALDLGKNSGSNGKLYTNNTTYITNIVNSSSGPNTKLLFHPMVIGTVNIIGSLIKDLVFH